MFAWTRSWKLTVRQHWVWIACALAVLMFLLIWWLEPSSHRRRFRAARDRLTTSSSAPWTYRGSGGNVTSNEYIAQSIREFATIANDRSTSFIERARAMNWLSQIYRVGWGPYRRNEAISKKWADAAGIRFNQDLDLMDADDRSQELPVYEPIETRPMKATDERSMNALRRIQEETATEVLHQQNVHNSGVTQSVYDLLTRYQRMHPMSVLPETVQKHMSDIRQRIGAYPDRERARLALWVLDRIESSVTPLVRSGLTESQILSLVWSRQYDLNMTPEQTIDLLVERLNDCIEHQSIVCTTGRVTHIVDTWSGIDEHVKLRTKEQAKEERLRSVQRLVNECVARMHPNDQKRWNEDSSSIEDLRRRVTDFVLSQMVVDAEYIPEIQQWIQSL